MSKKISKDKIYIQTYIEEYFRQKFEAKQRRKEFFEEFLSWIKAFGIALGCIGLALFLIFALIGGIYYTTDRNEIIDRLSNLEANQHAYFNDNDGINERLNVLEHKNNTNFYDFAFTGTNVVCYTNKIYYRMEHPAFIDGN